MYQPRKTGEPPQQASVVRFTTPATSPSLQQIKQKLAEHGIAADEMQKAFLSLRNTERTPLIALSFISLDERRDEHGNEDLAKKFTHYINATLAMHPREKIDILLPVELALLYEMQTGYTQVIATATQRLKKYATEVFGLEDSTILEPLLQRKSVTIKANGTTLVFHPLADYISPGLHQQMVALEKDLAALLKTEYSSMSFLNNQAQDIKNILKNSTALAGFNWEPLTQEHIEAILHAVIFRSITYLAKDNPNLQTPYQGLCTSHGQNLAEHGPALLRGLYDTDAERAATAFSKSIMFKFVETIVMKPILENPSQLVLYCSNKNVKTTEPLYVEAKALEGASGIPRLETGNSYNNSYKASSSAHSQPMDIPSSGNKNDFPYLLGIGIGMMKAAGQHVDAESLGMLLNGIALGCEAGTPRKGSDSSVSSRTPSSSGNNSDDETSNNQDHQTKTHKIKKGNI